MADIALKREITGGILDLGGGGEGIVGRIYGKQATAIDNRQDELDEAPEGPTKLLMDACALTFDDCAFDNVTAFYFLMYLPNEARKTALAEAFRVLRPGGKLFVWDAEIAEAKPFLVNLCIDAGGETVNTAYGVYCEDAAQTAESTAGMIQSLGFRPLSRQESNGQFYMCFKKP